MERKINEKLLAWKQSDNRKPLILQGARQTGKTYSVNLFGKENYANVVYCNFEREKELQTFFSDLSPANLLSKISNFKRKEILPEQTLIIFDEIQACPEALTSLKYFCEDAPQYHVIALGSLLGIAVNRAAYSFPVGKVDFMNMYPLDFEEFLLANDQAYLIEEIKKSYQDNKPLPLPFHELALQLYKTYLFVGGMPEVIEEYLKNKNSDLVQDKQHAIIDSYFNDMGKYNKATEIPKTKLLYRHISTQLAKENKKFKYSLVKTGGRASEFASALEWLCLSGVAHQLHRLDQIKLPLNAYQSLDDFKFYMNDVGLCCASQNVLMDDMLFDNPGINDFKGGLTENYVNNQLIINGLNCFYWTSKNQAEIDFITRIGKDIIPLEVKSNENTRSRSLTEYNKKYNPAYSIRISAKNFGFENNIKSVPLYAVFCIR